ncbi:MAG: ABC transporter ATP-binding protein [Rhodospirillales bacterium]|nr:ABC transporter ATP-binding protein [Rhodospirillales bacterium]
MPLIAGSIRDNLLYPLQRQPLQPAAYSDDAQRLFEERCAEAEKTGNSSSDPYANWTDYAAAGVTDECGLTERVLQLLDQVELSQDMFSLGLRQSIDPDRHPKLAARILEARRQFGRRLGEKGLRGLVESFHPERYNRNMSVAENILFGTPVGPTFDPEHIAENPYLRRILDRLDLTDEMIEIGFRVAKVMIDLFRDIPPGHEAFERFSFISADDLPEVQSCVRRVESESLSEADDEDRMMLLSLPFKLIANRHRLGLNLREAGIGERFLAARAAFMTDLPADLAGSIAFFDPNAYNAPASIEDNILFGKVTYGRPQARRQISALLAEIVDSLDLRREIADQALNFEVGIGGSRLSAVQRQKIALARACLKRPDLLILDRALDAFGPAARESVMARLMAESGELGIIFVASPGGEPRGFDRRITMEAGKVTEHKALAAPDAPATDPSTAGIGLA